MAGYGAGAASAGPGLSLILLGLVGTSTPVVVLALILSLNGIGRSIGATGYSTVIFSDVPEAEMRHANTLMITVQVLAATLGIAGGAIALRVGEPVGRLFGASNDTHVAYTVAFLLVACLALLSTFVSLRMHPNLGRRTARRSRAGCRAAAGHPLTAPHALTAAQRRNAGPTEPEATASRRCVRMCGGTVTACDDSATLSRPAAGCIARNIV